MKKIVITAFMCLMIFACTTQKQKEEFSVIYGRVAIYGTSEFTYVGVKNPDDGSFYAVVGDLEQTLREKYQLKTVKLKGKFLDSINHESVKQFSAVEFVE